MRTRIRPALAALVLAALATAVRAAPPTVPTRITVAGGAAGASQLLPPGQGAFGLKVPLRLNAENVVTVTATDENGNSVTSAPFTIFQLSLTEIVTAQVTAQRLSPAEVKDLVADGTIDVEDPENFNVSMFVIVLTIAGRQLPVSVPVVKPVTDPVGFGPPIRIGCQNDPSRGLETTASSILIPCGGGGGARNQPPVQVIPFTVEVPGAPQVATIPGVIVIEGRIKTLKEFFRINLILTNVSGLFTLTDVEALLEVPAGALTPIAPASGPIVLPDLAPGDQQTGSFIVRGDQIGVHTVTAHFGAKISGLGLPEPVPVSGSASTDLEVKGPPKLDVKVSHPSFVFGGEPYELTVEITNVDDELPALYTTFELDVGADARLIDPVTEEPLVGPSVHSLGDLFPGDSSVHTFTVLPLKTGPITSCTAGVTQNIQLTVDFVGPGGPDDCAIGFFPSPMQDPSGRPTVLTVPTHNTTGVTVDPAVVAIFSAPMLSETITTGSRTATFQLLDPNGDLVPVTREIAALGSGNTLAILRPVAILQPGSQYTILVLPDIFGQSGLPLASGLTARFTTEGVPPPADTVDPTATLTIEPPVTPGAVPQGQLVPVRVDSDDNERVTRVDLRLDGAFVDTREPASPVFFMLDTVGLAPGSVHRLDAIAYDAQGNSGEDTATIMMAPDTTPPTVEIHALATVQRGRRLPVTVDTADDGGVKLLQVRVDGADPPVFRGVMEPFVFSFPTGPFVPGEHTLGAEATDGAGNTAGAEVVFDVVDDTQPPEVVFLSPVPGQQVLRGTPLSVTAVATDDVLVDSLTYFLDAEATPRTTARDGFVLDTGPLALGAHTARVVARDPSGNETTAQVGFTLFTIPPDTTPPDAPNPALLSVTPPEAGIAIVTGLAGAVENGARVEVVNLSGGATTTVVAGGTGAFAAGMEALGGEVLRLTAIDLAGNRSATTDVIVPVPPSLVGFVVTPGSVALGPSKLTQQLAVTGQLSDGTTTPLTAGVTFRSDDPSVAGVSGTGLVAPGKNGGTMVHVDVTGFPTADVPVSVDFPTVTAVQVSPNPVQIPDLGRTQQLSVTALLSNGTQRPFSGTVAYGAQDVTIATVTSKGRITGVGEGTTNVLVAPTGFPTISVSVTVQRAVLTSIFATPAAVTLVGAGETVQLAVAGVFSDGSIRAVAGATFGTSNAAVADVDATGLVISGDDGDADVTVTVAGVAPAVVPVHVKSLTSIAIAPAAFTLIGADKTRQLSVVGTFSDGSMAPVTADAAFDSDDEGVATVSPGGLVTSHGTGEATITAQVNPTATATVTVVPVEPVSLFVVPPTALLTAAGQTVQLAVFVRNNDGSSAPATAPVFFSPDEDVATVDAAGLVTAVANGSIVLDVTVGALDTTVPVTVDIAPAVPAPVIDALDRPRAGEGDPVVLRGRNFAPLPGDDLVLVNGLAATVERARADELTVLVPAGATSGPVTVEVNGQTSNAVDLEIYARRAVAREITPGVDVAASPGQTLNLNLAGVEVRAGDVVFLSSAPDVLAPLDFDGTLAVRVDGGAPIAVPPEELTPFVGPGTHTLTLSLTEDGGRIRTGPVFAVFGPDGTGPIAGERSVVALDQSRPTRVTFLDLVDLAGVPLPDGTKVAASAANTNFTSPDGTTIIQSIGGAIVGGDATPNDSRFRTFTVTGGRLALTYDPATVDLAVGTTGIANVIVVPADAAGSRIGTQAIAVASITLTTYDTAAGERSASSAVADGLSKIVAVTLRGIRDATGQLVPDGAQVAVTAADTSFTSPDGTFAVRSAGGAIVNGTGATNDGRFKILTIANGEVEIQYDPAALELPVGDVRTANVLLVPATADGARIGSRAFAVIPITLSAPAADPLGVAVTPPSALADFGDNRVVVTVSGITDVLGSPVPDGTKVAASAKDTSFTSPDGTASVRSAGGEIVNGDPTPNDGRFRTLAVTGGQVTIVYSAQGVDLDARQSALANVVVVPATPAGGRIGTRAFAVAPVTLAGYQTAQGTANPPSAVADGFSKTVTVSLTAIRDTEGVFVPDGAKVAATADKTNFTSPDGTTSVGSAGGLVANGVVTSNDGRFRTLEVSGGAVTIQYDPGGVLLDAGEVATANVLLVPARPTDGRRIGTRAFVVVPITLSAPNAAPAGVSVVPGSVLADGGDNRAIVTVSDITDVLGNPVPDGTTVAASAKNTNFTSPDGSTTVQSAGGEVLSGFTSPNDGRFQALGVAGGQASAVYSALGEALAARESDVARVVFVPAQPSGSRIGTRAFAVGEVILAGYQSADIAGPGALSPGATGSYTVTNLLDTAGVPIPDGARVGVSAANTNFTSPDGSTAVGSAGGTIQGGDTMSNDGRFRVFTVTGGQVTFDFEAPSQSGVTSVIQLVPTNVATDGRIGTRLFATKSVAIGP